MDCLQARAVSKSTKAAGSSSDVIVEPTKPASRTQKQMLRIGDRAIAVTKLPKRGQSQSRQARRDSQSDATDIGDSTLVGLIDSARAEIKQRKKSKKAVSSFFICNRLK